MSYSILLYLSMLFAPQTDPGIQIRINQVGYNPEDTKTAVVFSHKVIKERFVLKNLQGNVIQEFKLEKAGPEGWKPFAYYYILDFSAIEQEGTFYFENKSSSVQSQEFRIVEDAYSESLPALLGFMQQQRCGYNPYLDMVCHQRDGRSAYGPLPEGTYVDATGGWHDAGDQLKYLITGSYATAHMIMSYELYPDKFEDRVNELGQPGANGLPDVLDEAKWGLDWIHKLHPKKDHLIHQVADDRDHRGWKMPDEDISDYGWGPNSYRVAYFATGQPQGLREHKSKATGLANLAGRSAAAMALGARAWESIDPIYAEKCLKAAKSLYQFGKENEGYQQGNSFGAPYRYNEETWTDDMEWGAAELYKLTGEQKYLNDAKRYAELAGSVGWTTQDTASHYQYYPFINMGHFALYNSVDEQFKEKLAGYYREGLEHTRLRAEQNPYGVGIPFIWCSNNLLTSLITQGILYEKMTGDESYRKFIVDQRDWLFGKNPWGTSMFMNIPLHGEFPVDVHTSIWAKTKKEVPGGLVDGPVYTTIYDKLLGLVLNEPDEFANVQTDYVVYHDDIGDYSTNEPTMDGTAGSVLMFAHFGRAK